jgi:DHA2 family lincomycin resistance protein-like MFS transporter
MKRTITIMQAGVFLALLAETYLNAALPALMEVFAVTADRVQWLTSLYMLVMGLCVPLSAHLIGRMTRRSLFLTAMALFALGTLGGVVAPSFIILLLSRLVQAAGASMTLPLMIHTIMESYEEGERGGAMGKAMVIVLFAPALGPIFGALLLQIFSWRSIFLVTLAGMIVILVWAHRALPASSPPEKKPLDILSLLLTLFGFSLLVVGLQQTLSRTLSAPAGLGIMAVGGGALIIFGFRQKQLEHPFLAVTVLVHRTYTVGVLLIILIHLTMFASFILLPMFLIQVVGLPPFIAGLAMLPGGIIGALAPPVAGRIYDRRGVGRVVVVGFALMVGANILFSRFTADQSVYSVIATYIALMCGFGITLTPVQTHSLAQLNPKEMAHGTAILNTMMLVSSSMGGALFVTLMAAQGGTFVDAFTYTYGWVSLIALLALPLSLVFGRRSQ